MKLKSAGMALTALVLFSTAAIAQRMPLEEMNGGGGRASATMLVLHGAIVGHGLGGATLATATSPQSRMTNGFIPSLAPIISRTVADPAWLELSAGDEPASGWGAELASWRSLRQSEPLTTIDLTGWQL